MSFNIKDIKCECCKCYDCFDGCQGVDCDVDFEISAQKVHETAKVYKLSSEFIMKILLEEKARILNERMSDANEQLLPDNFDPKTDSNFLISFADAIDIGKKRLVDLDNEELQRLRTEIDFIIEMREADE